MKSVFLKTALLCASFATLCGCVEELENKNAAPSGSEIAFGARAGFENSNPDTKTVYTGEKYYVGDVAFERIDWLDAKDKIEMYCPQAINGPTSHYQISRNNHTDDQHDYATLVRIGESSLQWNGDGEHTFYAMYPSSHLFNDSESTVKQGVKMIETQLNGIVPTTQNPIETVIKDENIILKPDMRYAYMAAKTTATRFDETVSLTFVPVVTAVEVNMVLPRVDAGQDLTISEIQVHGTGITGAFTSDLGSWNGTYPTCTNASTGGNMIQISPKEPIKVKMTKSVTFTVFVRPGTDISDLKVSVSSDGASYANKNIEVSIPKGKKTVLKNLTLPSTIKIDASKWMSQLDPNTQMNRLSIPGTGSTFSYNYNGSDKTYVQAQTLTLEEQWNKGIRAFEIVTNRGDSKASLGDLNVECNDASMGQKLNTVFDALFKKVTAKGSDETAILILTYQPHGYSTPRDVGIYATNLKNWYNSMTQAQKDALLLYRPNLTLGDAKNHILVIVRPNQKDEDAANAFETAKTNLGASIPFLMVDGCGTSKDRWGARGYTVNGKVAYDMSNGHTNSECVEYYMAQRGDYINPLTHANVHRGNMNFVFNTNANGIQCWYQEWSRVAKENIRLNTNPSNSYPSWFESYNEKLEHVFGTFDMAVSDQYQQYVFINSLCGHYTDKSNSSSLQSAYAGSWGGRQGNVKDFAKDINQAFYEHVRNSGFESKTGPTGIIMMNLVSNNESDGGSYFLPGTIISNNFKHNVGNN